MSDLKGKWFLQGSVLRIPVSPQELEDPCTLQKRCWTEKASLWGLLRSRGSSHWLWLKLLHQGCWGKSTNAMMWWGASINASQGQGILQFAAFWGSRNDDRPWAGVPHTTRLNLKGIWYESTEFEGNFPQLSTLSILPLGLCACEWKYAIANGLWLLLSQIIKIIRLLSTLDM